MMMEVGEIEVLRYECVFGGFGFGMVVVVVTTTTTTTTDEDANV